MSILGAEVMTFFDILDDAAYARRELKIVTQSRGVIIGTPDAVDEYDSDPERLGYCLAIGENEADTVFLDEITAISINADSFVNTKVAI
jgi:hypothetical protein